MYVEVKLLDICFMLPYSAFTVFFSKNQPINFSDIPSLSRSVLEPKKRPQTLQWFHSWVPGEQVPFSLRSSVSLTAAYHLISFELKQAI